MGTLLICQIIACAIALTSFVYGTVYLLKKKTPQYQHIIMWSVGCFLLYVIAAVFTSLVFPVKELEANISLISVFGCFLALFSANYGGIDHVVNDNKNGSKLPVVIAFAAIGVFAASLVYLFFIWKDIQILTGICFVIAYLPILPAAYYNIKHLLLPVDELEILKRNRGINVLSVVLYISFIVYAILLTRHNDLISGVCYIVSSCIVMGITIFARKGIFRW